MNVHSSRCRPLNARLLIAVSSALLLSTVGALATDLPRPINDPSPPESPTVTSDFNGFYAGAEVGAGWANGAKAETPTAVAKFTDDDRGGTKGGLFAGYNYQMGQMVFGAELAGHIDNSETKLATGQIAPSDRNLSGDLRNKWDGALRGRVGYIPVQGWPILAYATGGVTAAGFTEKTAFQTNSLTQANSKSSSALGWQVGGGIEGNIGQFLGGETFLRSQYLYGQADLPHSGAGSNLALKGGTVDTQELTFGIGRRF